MVLIFRALMESSPATAIFIACAFAIRFFMRKKPASQLFLIWIFVLVRLLVPVSLGGGVKISGPDLLNTSGKVLQAEAIEQTAGNPEASGENKRNHGSASYSSENVQNGMKETTSDAAASMNSHMTPARAGCLIWLAGIGVFAVNYFIGMKRLRKKTAGSAKLSGFKNVYVWDASEACVIGVTRPRIYIPEDMDPDSRRLVICHEREHIAHHDNLFVLLFYCALAVNWFDPLAYPAMKYAVSDMERACDERVLKESDVRRRRAYARVLVSFYNGGHEQYVPVKFGGSDIVKRVKNIGEKKIIKKRFTVMIVLACCAVMGICALLHISRVTTQSVQAEGREQTGSTEEAGTGSAADVAETDTELIDAGDMKEGLTSEILLEADRITYLTKDAAWAELPADDLNRFRECVSRAESITQYDGCPFNLNLVAWTDQDAYFAQLGTDTCGEMISRRVYYKFREDDLAEIRQMFAEAVWDAPSPYPESDDYKEPDSKHAYSQEYIPGTGNIKGDADIKEFSDANASFAIGADSDGYAVFKDPEAAWNELLRLYADGIRLIQAEFQLEKLDQSDYESYKELGWQVTIGTEDDRAEADFVSGFMDIYENSFRD